MADRIVKVILRGDVAGLKASMAAASKSVADTADKMTGASKEAVKFRQGLSSVGDTAGKVGLVAAAGLGAITLATANFDQAMSNVAATGDEARASLDQLREAAIKAGADTAFSASEAAGGIENLLKAGVSAQDVLGGGLSGALDLAAAGELEVADAAEIAATAMTQFKLGGEDVTHIADLLAAGAGKAQGDVSDLAMALKQGGLVASQMGLSIEETTGTLSAFASAGLLGSDAGTSLKTMLLRLANPANEAKREMERLGIAAYDANGNFVGMEDLAGQLAVAFEGQSQSQRDAALATIFGSDAIRAASVLYQQGATGIADWTAKVNDSGYAAETAATRLDNLKGDWEAFTGSLETALIGSGEGSQGMLRGLVQGATDAVNAFNALPPILKNVSTGMLGITAISGGGLWFGAKMISSIADTRATFTDLGVSLDGAKGKLKSFGTAAADNARSAGAAFSEMSGKMVAMRGGAAVIGLLATQLNTLDESSDRATKTMGEFVNIGSGALMGFAVGGPIGAAVGGGIAAIGSLVGALNEGDVASRAAAEGAREYAGTLDEVTGAATSATRALVAKRLEEQGVLEDAARLGLSTDQLVDGILGTGDAATQVRDQLAGLRAEYTNVTGEALTLGSTLATEGGLKNAITDAAATRDQYGELVPVLDRVSSAFGTESKAVSEAAESTQRQAEAAGEASGATDEFAGAMDAAAGATQDSTAAIEANIDAMRDQRSAAIDAANAEIGYQSALDDAAAAAKENGKTLDITTDKGRENKRALLDLAAAWNAQSDVAKETPGAYRQAIRTFVDLAGKMGMGKKEARELATSLYEIPAKRVVDVTVNGLDAAQQGVWDLTAAVNALPSSKTITFSYVTTGRIPSTSQNSVLRADGGPVYGPGTATSDSIPAYLSNGEYVIRAAAVDKYGTALFDGLNAMRLASGGQVGMASGGSVDQQLDILRIQQQINDLRKDLAKDGKDSLKGIAREIAALELRAAQRELREARRAPMIEAREQRAAIMEIGRGFEIDPEMSVKDVREQLADFRESLRDAGGEWTKELKSMSADLIAGAREITDHRKALEAEAEAREKTREILEDQQRQFEQLTETMHQFGQSVASNFLSDPFGGANAEEGVTGVQALRARLLSDMQRAEAFGAALTTLSDRGVSGTFFSELAARGDVGTAQELAALDEGALAELQDLWTRREAAASQVGTFAAQQVYGQQVAEMQAVMEATKIVLTEQSTVIKELNRELRELGAEVRAGAKEGVASLAPEINRSTQGAVSNWAANIYREVRTR